MTHFEAHRDESDFTFDAETQVNGTGFEYDLSETDAAADRDNGYAIGEPEVGDGIAAEDPEDGDGDLDDEVIAAFFREEEDKQVSSTPPMPPIDLPPTTGGFEQPDENGDNQPSPELADMVFDVLASQPPTILEQEDIRLNYGAIRWLGTEHVQSPIFRIFNAGRDDSPFGAVNQPAAMRILERHFDDFADYISEIDEALRATQTVREMASEYAARGVIEEEAESIYALEGNGLFLGQYVVRRIDDTLSITERALPPNSQYPRLLRYDRPDGDIHLVHPDSHGRYSIEDTPDGTTVTRQTIHTIRPHDVAYIHDLNRQFVNHRRLLLDVAEAAGFSRDTLVDPETQRLNMDVISQQVAPVIAGIDFRLQLPLPLHSQLRTSVVTIWHSLRPSSLPNTYTGEREDQGLHAVAMRVRPYFDHLIKQRPDL